MNREQELAHLRAPSSDPKQRQIDYWGRRAEKAEAEIERLRGVLMGVMAWIDPDNDPPALSAREVMAKLRADLAACEQNGDDNGKR